MNPNSKKPKLLDFIRQHTGRYNEDLDPRAHGHKTWEGVFNEIREDEALAKVRDETGKEPKGNNVKTIRRPTPSWER
jgi:hypothetical protein